MDDTDRRIIDVLQQGFPICDSPYEQAAQKLGLNAEELIARLQRLLTDGVLSRFGPLYHAERMDGALMLAALRVPEQRFDEVADIVNGFPEVAHNYRREHRFNMWFVLASDDPARIAQVIDSIEKNTRLKVYRMPKIREYYVGLRLKA